MQWLSDAVYRYIGDLIIFFWQTANWFAGLERDTAGWIWPFKLLSEPFGVVAYYLHEVHYKLGELRNEVQHYTDFLNEIFGLTGLNKLLNWIWWEWDSFKNDPKLYIRFKLSAVIPNYWLLETDPWDWLLIWVRIHYNQAYYWLIDPLGEVNRWLQDKYPGMWSFFDDPLQSILTWIRSWSEEAYQFIYDPIFWIKTKIVDQLGWSGQFWLDPWGYLFDELTSYIERSVWNWGRKLSRVGENVLQAIWEGRIQ